MGVWRPLTLTVGVSRRCIPPPFFCVEPLSSFSLPTFDFPSFFFGFFISFFIESTRGVSLFRTQYSRLPLSSFFVRFLASSLSVLFGFHLREHRRGYFVSLFVCPPFFFSQAFFPFRVSFLLSYPLFHVARSLPRVRDSSLSLASPLPVPPFSLLRSTQSFLQELFSVRIASEGNSAPACVSPLPPPRRLIFCDQRLAAPRRAVPPPFPSSPSPRRFP